MSSNEVPLSGLASQLEGFGSLTAGCRGCRSKIKLRTFGSENWEPDYDPGDDPVTWRHPDGYAYRYDHAAMPLLQPNYVYVASSWRNQMQDAVVKTLAAAKIPHYDFKNPDTKRSRVGVTGCHDEKAVPFRWTDVGMPRDEREGGVLVNDYFAGLSTRTAARGFSNDYDAMRFADTFVLVLPCNRSAHLELGWAVGQGKRTAILLEEPMEPELMYRMVDYLSPNLVDLLLWLGVED